MADPIWRLVPHPTRNSDGTYTPNWNEVALFFNLASSNQPAGYRDTSVEDAREWLDEGSHPATPTTREVVANYWGTLSYGQFAPGINAPRDAAGNPLIPTVTADSGNWGAIIRACVDANAEAIWRAAGSLMNGTNRFVPSVVLIQNYPVGATASIGDDWTSTVGDHVYEFMGSTHIQYDLSTADDVPGVTPGQCRWFWTTLCHENGHNFTECYDLYGPQGCAGYWDLLGDHLAPGHMSEVCSVTKYNIGWLRFRQVVEGPSLSVRQYRLSPYTTTGAALKVVPDPTWNPEEFFVLEYRGSTGNEVWRPDGGLPEGGLLITHIDNHLGIPPTWLSREAPYFHPVMANFGDNGGTLWTGWQRDRGFVFPQGDHADFTPDTTPNSNFYGRPSGLRIQNIHIEGEEVVFDLSIECDAQIGWSLSTRDRAIVGRFTPESAANGQEILLRNDGEAALLHHRQAHWFSVARQSALGGWSLAASDRQLAADLDGDGLDEIYFRSSDRAGVVRWGGSGFVSVFQQSGRIGDWILGAGDRELAADLDGDGVDEIYVRSAGFAGVFQLVEGSLALQTIASARVGSWTLSSSDQELIGHFTTTDAHEVLVCNGSSIGVFHYDATTRQLQLRGSQSGTIDGWQLNGADQRCVGDFDGDGFDEVYLRSASWAGVIKWQSGAFHLLWSRQNDWPSLYDHVDPVPMQASDRSYAGRFLATRDGVLNRGGDGRISIMTWESSAMKIRYDLGSPLDGYWSVGAGDTFVLGDFQRVGMDVGDPTVDFITDHLTDVFTFNGTSAAMFGVENFQGSNDPGDKNQIGITWLSSRVILGQDVGTVVARPSRYHIIDPLVFILGRYYVHFRLPDPPPDDVLRELAQRAIARMRPAERRKAQRQLRQASHRTSHVASALERSRH